MWARAFCSHHFLCNIVFIISLVCFFTFSSTSSFSRVAFHYHLVLMLRALRVAIYLNVCHCLSACTIFAFYSNWRRQSVYLLCNLVLQSLLLVLLLSLSLPLVFFFVNTKLRPFRIQYGTQFPFEQCIYVVVFLLFFICFSCAFVCMC